MIAFAAAAAALVLGTAGFVAWLALRRARAAQEEPGRAARELNVAVYRDQLAELEAERGAGTLAAEDFERARRELERRLLDDVGPQTGRAAPGRRVRAASRGAVLAAAALVPLFGGAVYLVVGNPEALDPRRHEARIGPAEIEAMVESLAKRLEENPDDVEVWKMLGRSYAVLGRFAEAANAYARGAARAPRDAGLLVDLADALAMSRNQSLQGEPEELVMRALQLEPQNLKALALAGTAAFDRQDYAGAVRYWERMLPLVPAGSDDARTIQSNLDEAKALAGQAKPAAAPGLSGTVRLSPALAAKVSPGDTVFVFARALQGGAMPLAALKKRVADLPLAFTLDDSMAMSPERKLSAVPKVVVVARVSKAGTPAPRPGDLQGTSAPVSSNAKDVTVTIDTEVR